MNSAERMDMDYDDVESCNTVDMAMEEEPCIWCNGEGCDECTLGDGMQADGMSFVSTDSLERDAKKLERKRRLEEAKYKPYLDKGDIEVIQEDKIDSVATLACVHRGLAEAFLQEYNWDEEKVKLKVLEQGGSRALAEMHKLPFVLGRDEDEEVDEYEAPIEAGAKCCIVMCENDDPSQLHRLWCGHIVCRDCLQGCVDACLPQMSDTNVCDDSNGRGNGDSDGMTQNTTSTEEHKQQITTDHPAISPLPLSPHTHTPSSSSSPSSPPFSPSSSSSGLQLYDILNLRCPALNTDGTCRCMAALPRNLVMQFIPEEYKLLVENAYLERSIRELPGIFKCPRLQCSYALHLPVPLQSSDSHAVLTQERDVTCLCDGTLCGVCGHEYGHEPAPCDFVDLYQRVMDPERRTREFLEAATKPCPKCHVLTEKNRNCNHMSCTRCRYEYCWLCGVDWHKHNGSYYNCEQFSKGKLDEERKKLHERQRKTNIVQQLICAQERQCEACLNNIKTIDTILFTPSTRLLFTSLPRLHDALLTCKKVFVNLHWCYAITSFLSSEDNRSSLFISQRNTLQTRADELLHIILSEKSNFRTFEESGKYHTLMKAIDSVANFRIQLLQSVKELNLQDLIQSKIDSEPQSTAAWACIRCGTRHKATAPVFSLDDFSEKEHSGKTQRSSSGNSETNSSEERNAYVDPQTQKVFCSKKSCQACKEHSESDCRICVRR